jgi:methionyl-tRNA synthetase
MQLCANLAIFINPFLPFTATKMCRMMKVVDRMLDWENSGSLKLLQKGYPMNAPELLFKKIEDEQIVFQSEKLKNGLILSAQEAAAGKPNEETSSVSTSLKETIQFEDFDKIDLRVGKILTAEKVEKADKLLKLTIDLGFEQRTVVSGIALHYTPEEIIGMQVTLVANLAPRKMRGIESNGMILMAENAEGKLIFINPHGEAMNGSAVK